MAKNSPFLKQFQEKINVIPLGIHPEEYKKLPLKDHGRFIICWTPIYYKGFRISLSPKKTSIKLVMIGEGPLESMIKEEGKDLIKNGQLVLLPFQKRNISLL